MSWNILPLSSSDFYFSLWLEAITSITRAFTEHLIRKKYYLLNSYG